MKVDSMKVAKSQIITILLHNIKIIITDIFESDGMHETTEHDVSISVVSHPYSSLLQSNTEPPDQNHTELNSSQDPSGLERPTTQNSDEDVCAEFVRRTCGCKKANGMPCSSLFSVEHYITLRAQSALLTRNELDMVILGSLMSTTLDDNHCVKDGRHKGAKRHKVSSNFMHHGYNVCKATYAFLYGIGVNHRVLAIRKHYQEHGLEPRTHQNSKRLPARTLSFDDITRIVNFLQQYAEQHAILLPGRVPNHKRDDVKLLPSSTSKKVKGITPY